MRYLASALVLFCATSAQASLVTIQFAFTGTVTSYSEDLFVFPGQTAPIVPITDIHAGDTFTGNSSFTFDPNQIPFRGAWAGNYESTITVDGHDFPTTGAAGADLNQVVGDPPSYAFVYNTNAISGMRHTMSELDFAGSGVYPPNADFATKLVSDLATFQGGSIFYDFADFSPDIYRFDRTLQGNLTTLTLTTPEPGTLAGAVAGLGTLCLLARQRRSNRSPIRPACRETEP